MRNQYTAEQREKLVGEVRATGERVSVVAKRLGVSSSAAYLWLKATEPTTTAPTFAKVVPLRSRALRVEVGGVAVVVESGFDAELLRHVVAVLGAEA
jgi:transposase